MASFKFDLVSPERLLVSEDVESVIIRAPKAR
jgi:F0F1-type ATP synthase epsilon subunit